MNVIFGLKMLFIFTILEMKKLYHTKCNSILFFVQP